MMGNDVVAEYANIDALAPLDSYFQAWSRQVGHDITQDFYPGEPSSGYRGNLGGP